MSDEDEVRSLARDALQKIAKDDLKADKASCKKGDKMRKGEIKNAIQEKMAAMGAFEDDRIKDYGKAATDEIRAEEKKVVAELEAKRSLQKTEAKRVDTTTEIERAYNRAKLAIMTANKEEEDKKMETIGEQVEKEEKREKEDQAEEEQDEKDLQKSEKKKVAEKVVEKLEESAKEVDTLGAKKSVADEVSDEISK